MGERTDRRACPRALDVPAGAVAYGHRSLFKSLEEIFGLPIVPTVAAANDFADLFEVRPGPFPDRGCPY
jgi:hypothetical protein